MKVGRVILAAILGVVVVVIAWRAVTGIMGLLMTLLSGLVGIAIAALVIGGLGWAILRLLGRKSLTGGNSQFLP